MASLVGTGTALGGFGVNTTAAAGDNEFVNYGPFAVSLLLRGWVSTTDGADNDIVLAWLTNQSTKSGWVAMINVDSGEIQEFWPPLGDEEIYAPYASLLSSQNRWYFCDNHFAEFDPTEPGFTFTEANLQDDPSGQLGMSLTEDNDGVIWSACYPDGSVFSFDPETEVLRDYGPVFDASSLLYPRSLATDDAGWVYIALHLSVGQVVMLNAETGETALGLPDEDRFEGYGGGGGSEKFNVYRGVDGKVYARAGETWFEFHDGNSHEIGSDPRVAKQQFELASGTQQLDYRQLPSGQAVTEFAPSDQYLIVKNPETGVTTRTTFTPTGGSAQPMGVTLTLDDNIIGGTYLPLDFFSYDPSADSWLRDSRTPGQLNTTAIGDDYVYFGSYPEGSILQWDPNEPWDPGRNPLELAAYSGRPYTLLAQDDGPYVILGGRGHYGETGKGLLFWNRETQSAEVVNDEAIIPHHSTFSLVNLPSGGLLGGTTVKPARGGERKADLAKLYMMDPESKEVTWIGTPLDGVQSYDDLLFVSHREVIGIANRTRLFVFDSTRQRVIYEENLGQGIAYQQGPEPFVRTTDGRIFLLLSDGTISQIVRDVRKNGEPRSYQVLPRVQAPTNILTGGVYLNDDLYYGTQRSLYSWKVPAAGPARLRPSETDVTVGERLTFDVEDISDKDRWIDSLKWNFGDGTTATGWWAEHRYNLTGSYTVTLTVTDDTGAKTTDQVVVTVSEVDGPFARIQPSATEVSTGERITFDVEDLTGKDRWIDSLKWNFGDETIATGWWAEHEYGAAGSYTVSLTVTDNAGQMTTDQVSITVREH